MIPKECKRLGEVDFPIAVVSKHAAREKSIRHGHPSTLHIWWARRPLASSRAVLLSLLLPDPCDLLCPREFKVKAKNLLPQVGCGKGETDAKLREGLLKFIGDFANWDFATSATYLDVARGLVKAAHPEETPLVVDPFAGGGSIPLEALRLDCDAFASDLNPVACMILKVMLEDIPRHGAVLAEELRKAGIEMKKKAWKELADFYPSDPGGAQPIAYLWARSVRCEAPNCGAEIPLLRSLWLSKNKNRRRALRPKAVKPHGGTPHVEFEIFEPKSEDDVAKGTVTRAKATCLCCSRTLAAERVRAQLIAQGGGADTEFDRKGHRIGGAWLVAVVIMKSGEIGRQYRLAKEWDYEAVRKAQKNLEKVTAKPLPDGLAIVPDEPLPLMSGTFNVPLYGVRRWGDMFTRRQALALSSLCSAIRTRTDSVVPSLLGCVLGRCADYWSSGVVWAQSGEFVAHTFGRQALPMIFDFAEAVPFTDSSGNLDGAVEWVAAVVDKLIAVTRPGQVERGDACESTLPDESAHVYFTDPPYYFAVPYADLSDYFFVWLKRAYPADMRFRDSDDPSNRLTPKLRELCEMKHWDPVRYPNKDQAFFEQGMQRAFAEGRRILRADGIGVVVFAHKTTEGWEALLSGMIRGGWTITGSWPIATERPGRLRSQDSAALATSVHLVCRPRTEDTVGDWADVLRELPKRVGDWMERLQGEGVRGADLVFACIGPALEIFSRYAKVETADGREVALAEYLEKVWEVVGRSALAQVLGTAEARARNGAAGAVEEDARLTALFLWTLQSTNGQAVESASDEGEDEESSDDDEDDEGSSRGKAKGFTLVFDVVRRFAQPLGIELPKWENRVIETKKGVVRLLPIAERAKQLFGEDGAQAVAARLEQETVLGSNPLQGMLFPEMRSDTARTTRGRGRTKRTVGDVSDAGFATPREATTLDRIHAAMLLQSGGRTNALRALLKAEQERGPDFLRLANALSALYPKGSEEKRLVDAMLLAVPR